MLFLFLKFLQNAFFVSNFRSLPKTIKIIFRKSFNLKIIDNENIKDSTSKLLAIKNIS
jgi:hypothetical protein